MLRHCALVLGCLACACSSDAGRAIGGAADAAADVIFASDGPQGPSCYDGTKNGDEADVDCGGSCARRCGLTRRCERAADCTDGICQDGRCGVQWVWLQGGTFMMGKDGFPKSSAPARPVTVPDFWMTKTEVTMGQYRQCLEAGVCSPLLSPGGLSCIETPPAKVEQPELLPALCVNWHQARDFCAWIDARLPSEAEWEYAARSGGQDWPYPWGTDEPTCEFAVYDDGTVGHPNPGINACGDYMSGVFKLEVCSKPRGNTLQGLCDMAGNALEWVEDCAAYYDPDSPSDGSARTQCESIISKILRSGIPVTERFNVLATFTSGEGPIIPEVFVGFRCARTSAQ